MALISLHMLITLKFTCPTQTFVLSSRFPHIAADSIRLLGVSQVLQTQQVQNSHCSLPETTVPPSIKLAKPETKSHYWPTYLSFTTVSSWSSFWLYLLNISLLTSLHLHWYPSYYLTTTVAWLITLHPLDASNTFLYSRQSAFEDRFIHSFIHWKKCFKPLLM